MSKKKSYKDIFYEAWAEHRKNAHKRSFFLPDLSVFGMIRMGIIILCAVVFLGFICRPAYIRGGSMKPTYPAAGVNFCWKPVFWFSPPKRGQVVIAKYVGDKVMLLKRVVALAGDSVEFRGGKLYVNKVEQDEPYIKYECNWNLPERKVEPGHVYLIGDNRSMSIHKHKFGQINKKRIIGVPLW